ncbi:hypothetical protein EN45_086540 [Penicillium chrysogenum]|uniref:Pc12g01400 protein n=2 Tax=Penicillium chrysogenum species complex TaxID=254878 RepID=B6GYS8_PENRW|nr:hypothetical protein EN45_086540 [Penicillium chrysogenum]CAP79767.1 Pc12g01400 [Penicillium rubens Wisconsin 54-1255]
MTDTALSSAHCLSPSLELKSYHEDTDFLAQGKPEPDIRSQTFIYHLSDQCWWIKVTFTGEFPYNFNKASPTKIRRKRERREGYQEFIQLIDYRSLPLLKDTVTEVLLEETAPPISKTLTLKYGFEDTKISTFISRLRLTIREDPQRVVYPSISRFPSIPPIKTPQLVFEEEVTDGVFRVIDKALGIPYVLKVLNRPLYQPRDTEVMEKELENLEEFKGVPGIVQAAGLAVSTDPYTTSMKDGQRWIISGVLLEYYGGGSLQHILDEQRMTDLPWERWPIQIGTALHRFHVAKKTHMDLKPSNIVIDSDGNAILIDVSGIGGITHQWLAPEIRNEISPLDLTFHIRQLNDTWAFGKLLSLLVSNARDSPFVCTLKNVANDLMADNSQVRLAIPDAICRLESGQ